MFSCPVDVVVLLLAPSLHLPLLHFRHARKSFTQIPKRDDEWKVKRSQDDRKPKIPARHTKGEDESTCSLYDGIISHRFERAFTMGLLDVCSQSEDHAKSWVSLPPPPNMTTWAWRKPYRWKKKWPQEQCWCVKMPTRTRTWAQSWSCRRNLGHSSVVAFRE